MYQKIIVNIILIFVVVIMQLSFLNGLPAKLNNLNLILIILVFILVLFGLDIAAWWTVGIGLLLDIFSFMPFGIYLVSLSLTIIITNFLLINFFTNRSLYSFLALVSIATLIYAVLLTCLSYFVNLLGIKETALVINKNFWLIKFYQLILNLIITTTIFYLINFISKKLRPVFLLRR